MTDYWMQASKCRCKRGAVFIVKERTVYERVCEWQGDGEVGLPAACTYRVSPRQTLPLPLTVFALPAFPKTDTDLLLEIL